MPRASVYEPLHFDGTLDELRRSSPVHFDEDLHGWRVLRYDDVRRVLTDADTFSAKIPWPEMVPIYLFMDDPAHGYFRGMTEYAFRKLPAWTAEIERTTADCVASMLGQETVDLAATVANRVPARTVAQLLGIPPADENLFYAHLTSLDTGRIDTLGTGGEFYEYFAAKLRDAAACPRDDLISHLAQVGARDGLSERDLVGVCLQILGAGIATTRHLVNWFFVMADPATHEAVRNDWGLLPGAIEETLRYRPPLATTYRLARENVTLSGQKIPAGALVLPTIIAANHDEAIFTDPARFDIRRRPNPHLGFSDGVHTCQGAGLARLETRIILRVLLARLDHIQLANPEALELYPGLNYGPAALPITFRPRAAAAPPPT